MPPFCCLVADQGIVLFLITLLLTATEAGSTPGWRVGTGYQGRGDCRQEKQGSVMQCWDEDKQGAANQPSCNYTRIQILSCELNGD